MRESSPSPATTDTPVVAPVEANGPVWSGPMHIGHGVEVPIGMPFSIFRERHPDTPCFTSAQKLMCEFSAPVSSLCPASTSCVSVLVTFSDGFLASYNASFASSGEWNNLRERFVSDGPYQMVIVPAVTGMGALGWKWQRGPHHLHFHQFMDRRGDSSQLSSPFGFGFGDSEFAPGAAPIPDFGNAPRSSSRGTVTLRPRQEPHESPKELSIEDKLRELGGDELPTGG